MKNLETIYYANVEADNIARQLVPHSSTKGYGKACDVANYIKTGERKPVFNSERKTGIMETARSNYLKATR